MLGSKSPFFSTKHENYSATKKKKKKRKGPNSSNKVFSVCKLPQWSEKLLGEWGKVGRKVLKVGLQLAKAENKR